MKEELDWLTLWICRHRPIEIMCTNLNNIQLLSISLEWAYYIKFRLIRPKNPVQMESLIQRNDLPVISLN